ncbi:hypothetical protein AB0B51_37405, partial [Streptomyces griseus]|uniref:HAD family hydrolase n=1 Tax=Streptomyces griseus TaxID=1911 RepID=UPI0034896A7D
MLLVVDVVRVLSLRWCGRGAVRHRAAVTGAVVAVLRSSSCRTVLVRGGPDGARGPLPAVTRLIATDLDGTLLRDDKTLSARTVAA